MVFEMGTNYYWFISTLPTGAPVPVNDDSPAIHIGKSSGPRFIWAQDRKLVFDTLEKHLDGLVVRDEYGQRFSGRQFRDLLEAKTENVYDSVGVVFC